MEDRAKKDILWIVFVLVVTLIMGMHILSIANGATIYNSFNSGELSPGLKYRVDVDKRYMGVATLENILVRPQGRAHKRPGTEYVADVNNSGEVRLFPFEYKEEDSYAIMFKHESIGFFRTVP